VRKKFDDVFIRFDTLSAVTDGHVDAGKTAERRAGNKIIAIVINLYTYYKVWFGIIGFNDPIDTV